MKLSEAIQRVGGPTDALQLLENSGIAALQTMSASNIYRWMKGQNEGGVLPNDAVLLVDVLANTTVMPLGSKSAEAKEKIRDRVIKCILVPHPAAIPLALVSRHFKSKIQPKRPTTPTARRIALGLSIDVKVSPTTDTKVALELVDSGVADCTVVPSATFEKFDKSKTNKVIQLCRTSIGPNIVLRRGAREIKKGERVLIYAEKLPSLERFAKRLQLNLDDVQMKGESVKQSDLEAVISGFNGDSNQVFFFGSTSFQDAVRKQLAHRTDMFIETNDDIRRHSDWHLCISERLKSDWEALRSLLVALKASSEDAHKIEEAEFSEFTCMPKEDMAILKDFRFPCDQISPTIINAWEDR